MKICLPSLISAALCCSPAIATAADFQPASFNFSPSTLENALANKNLRTAPAIAVYCQSDISEQGTNLRTSCFEKSGLESLETAIEETISTFNFIPASAEGEAVAVRMNYRVVYQNDGNDTSIILIPNIGTLQKELGVNYIEPQERLSSTSKNESAKNTFFEHNARHIRASASISTSGESKEVAVITKGTPKEDVTMVNTIKNTRFIPGFVDNSPVEMTYLAIIAKES